MAQNPKAHEKMLNITTYQVNANQNYKQVVFDHFDLTLVRMAINKMDTNNKCWRGYTEKGNLLHCWWECKQYSHYGEQYGGSLKT